MSDREPDGGESERNVPFSDMVEKVAERRGRADDEIWEEFTEQGFEPVETDGIWNGATDGGTSVEEASDGPLRGGNGSGIVDDPHAGGDGEIHTVPKKTYCERCPYFSEPPEINCSADGAEIAELVDMTRVRVKGCPVAADQEGLDGIL